ncbi:MAG: DUF5659 domain-containing protein [Candidatus Omnitrophica bacterium]|nr:DUF5659 domain-containing protein [Candidatus Omnitrophota bacterium]
MEKTFRTSDFYLTAYLLCNGLDFSYERDAVKNKVVFIFKDKEKAEKLVEDYYRDRAKISPKRYVEVIYSLKSFLFAQKEDGNGNKNRNEKNFGRYTAS